MTRTASRRTRQNNCCRRGDENSESANEPGSLAISPALMVLPNYLSPASTLSLSSARPGITVILRLVEQ